VSSRDPDDEFREIKREIIESRGLIIKTNNATSALAADVKSIAKRQAGYERRLTVNSATAYALFVILIFGGLKLWLDASIRERDEARRNLQAQVDRSRIEIAGLVRERDERQSLDNRAMAFYELVRENKRQETVEAWAQLRHERLPAATASFFQDTVDRFRTELSLVAFERGLEHARLARYQQAHEAYDDAIRLSEAAGHVPRVRIAQAEALRHLGRQREALVVLQAVADGADSDAADDALYAMSRCQADMQQYGEARNTLRLLLRRYPYGSISGEARLYLFNLSLPDPLHRRGR
jgi:tetratricopeptide (TPR) repeat protein